MEHTIDSDRIHHAWDHTLEPSLRISTGDTVSYELLMAGHGQVREGDSFADTRFDFDTLYNLLGPLHVEGARAGDTLRVDILELTPGDWGWCVILPELGTLPEDFAGEYLRTFDLRNGESAELAPGVRIPFSPFLGTMGTHPDGSEGASAFPPHKGGATSTPAISPPAPPCGSQCGARARCSRAEIRTRCRVTVRCVWPGWSAT